MPRFTQQFNIHAVGQGLFYSGKVTLNQNAFRLVFDCGSYNTAAIMREITHFENVVMDGSDELDLLVISHFDEDHVNHIKDMLLNVRRVKRLVMPFLTFEERLLLVTRLIARRRGFRAGDDPLITFILDPMSLLDNYLDGDSAVYLIHHEPGPIKPTGGDNEPFSEEGRQSLPEGGSLSFDFPNKNNISRAEWAGMNYSVPKAQLFKASDTGKGIISLAYVGLMEFLFYKRSLGPDEGKFYGLVNAYFIEKFGIKKPDVDTIMETVKTITSATEIKKIFRKAARECGLPLARTANMNTTALCMLHRDLPGILNIIYGGNVRLAAEESRPWFWPYQIRQYFTGHSTVFQVHKIVPYYNFPRHNRDLRQLFFVYPNTLLTSDTFLSSNAEMTEFDMKYEPYFKEIWLFQLPHHGSSYNIHEDFFMDTRYRRYLTYFVNHGLSNRSGHPDEEVLSWAQPGERCRKLRFIHELQGMEFKLELG